MRVRSARHLTSTGFPFGKSVTSLAHCFNSLISPNLIEGALDQILETEYIRVLYYDFSRKKETVTLAMTVWPPPKTLR